MCCKNFTKSIFCTNDFKHIYYMDIQYIIRARSTLRNGLVESAGTGFNTLIRHSQTTLRLHRKRQYFLPVIIHILYLRKV